MLMPLWTLIKKELSKESIQQWLWKQIGKIMSHRQFHHVQLSNIQYQYQWLNKCHWKSRVDIQNSVSQSQMNEISISQSSEIDHSPIRVTMTKASFGCIPIAYYKEFII